MEEEKKCETGTMCDATPYTSIEEIKELRQKVDALIKTNLIIHRSVNGVFPVEQVKLHLINAKMWLGKCLEAKGSELPAEFRDEAK